MEIRVENQAVAVIMRTPGHDDELAAGFLYTEDMILHRHDVLKIQPHPRSKTGNVVNVFLGPDVTIDFKKLTRHVFTSSSCGLCGKTSIDAVRQHFPKIKSRAKVAAKTLAGLPDKLREAQEGFGRTGALHAAAIFDLEGKLIVLREDVGRHNAVDKVLGYGFLHGLLPFDRHVLMVSGRTSFEIIQKAMAGRVPFVASVSAPSSLAVELARKSGQTLIGFLRGERMNIYSESKRVCFT